MLFTIKHCWAIVSDKRAPFGKNTIILIQILDTSQERKLIKESAVAQTTV